MNPAPSPTSLAGDSPPGAEHARILLVEDDRDSAYIIQRILERKNYHVVGVAGTDAEAIRLARDTKPDLILMDISLPGGHDGVKTAEDILREREVPIVYMTAYSDEATIARARRTAPFAYLLKPFREKEVLITIEMALYKARLDNRSRATELRLAATLGALAEYVITTDAAGKVTYLNPAAEHALGRNAATCLNHPLKELLDLRDRETRTRLADAGTRILQPGFHTDPSHPLLLLDVRGDARLVQIHTNALAEADGRPAGRVIILRDVTQLTQLEENIRQAQKLEAVGRLAGGIAHDFNNILAIINSFADLLALKTEPGHPHERYHQSIRTAGQRGADMVSRLMAFSRRQAAAPCPVAPKEIVEEVHKMIRPIIRENIEVIIEAPSHLPMLYTDPGHIEQILVNLCLNARDAIEDAGRIIISVSSRRFDATSAQTAGLGGPGSFILLSVTDTGSGIPPSVREKIFEPFFTTKDVGKGTGLGLAMVQSIVKQNHGHITVESEVGHGTSFTLYFPAFEMIKEADNVKKPAPSVGRGGHEHILLVEDDAPFAECLKNLLDHHGYTTVMTTTGEDAIKRFHERKGDFDLLLADLVLPKLSGAKLAAQLRQARPDLRVMFMTGYDNEETHLAMGAGVGRMDKPFSLSTLLDRVRGLLDEPVARR